jgi:hypothetical protein
MEKKKKTENNILETKEFTKAKSRYTVFHKAVKILNERSKKLLLLDVNDKKSIVVYEIEKREKGFKVLNSASFLSKLVSDDYYEKNNKNEEDITKSLIKLICSRLRISTE